MTLITSLWPVHRAVADAIVVTQAMKASTIVEIFIEDDTVRVKLEVGGEDIRVFRNLLPDELFEKVTGESRPRKERIAAFLKDDWRILADGGQLAGTIEEIEMTKRVLRDEITGEALPMEPGDAEIVIRASLRYPLNTQPKTISIHPPESDNGIAQANIGFVTYHRGVAVNDFRYLSKGEKLNLDWSDPWYSAFERKTLRRRYFAPAAAFLYIENFEVRKEIVIRPKDLQDWVDLGLDGKATIEADMRDAVCKKAAAYLGDHTPVEIDTVPIQGTLDRVHFIQRSLRTAGVVEPGKDIDINLAIIGAIYVYPRTSLPEKVTMQWELFNERITSVPTVATDQAGGMPGFLQPDQPVLAWQNFLKNPTVPAFLEVTPPPSPRILPISLITIMSLLGIVILWQRRQTLSGADSRPVARSGLLTIMLLAIATGASYWPRLRVPIPLQRQRRITEAEASDITLSLLHNIYRAFDYRDEGTVYDVLDRSASGNLLTKVYLETRESLTLASQGGARVKVKEVELISCESQSLENDTFSANCKWTVTGSVGHWGHVHQRKNQYNGEFRVRAIDGQWKFTEMELLSEERL